MSSTQGRVGLRLGFSENFRFRLGLGFYFSKNPVFGWVLGFFKSLKKIWKFSSKIVMKEEQNLRKSFNSSNLLQSIGLQWREKPWFHQKPTKIFDGQPLQHKIVRLLNAGLRIRPTYGKLVLSRSTTDFRLVLGPAFGSRTILIKKINPKKFFFGEIFLKIWLRFEKFSLKNNPK